MINRIVAEKIQKELFQKKAIVLLGARQVGKSTLLKKLFQNSPDVLWLDAENPDVHLILENASAKRLELFLNKTKLL
mgnify:CR=1 FL=1